MASRVRLAAMSAIPVYLEIGEKRVFASALEWPGWTRSAKDEQGALESLAAYAPRYASVPKAAHVKFAVGAKPSLKVVERVKVNATTDFVAPTIHAQRRPKSLRPTEPKPF